MKITQVLADEVDIIEVFGNQNWGDLYLLKYSLVNAHNNTTSYNSNYVLRADLDKYLKDNPKTTPREIRQHVNGFVFFNPEGPDIFNQVPFNFGDYPSYEKCFKEPSDKFEDGLTLIRFDSYDHSFWSPHLDRPLSRVYRADNHMLSSECFYLTKLEQLLKDHPWVLRVHEAQRYSWKPGWHMYFDFKVPQEIHNKIYDFARKNHKYDHRFGFSSSTIEEHLIWSARIGSDPTYWALGTDPMGIAAALKPEEEYDSYD